MYVECYTVEIPTVVVLNVKLEDEAAYSKDFDERREKVAKELRRRFAELLENTLATVLSGESYYPLERAIDNALCSSSLKVVTEVSELKEINNVAAQP